MKLRYFENTVDSTQTTIYLDTVVLEENYVSTGAGSPYSSLDAFLSDAHSELMTFIDKVMPPDDPMGGWLGDWIQTRKCESTDYSEYSGNPTTDRAYGSKELVDMATELIYSGWVYALGIQNDVTVDTITWTEWWNRSHREPGIWYVGF